MQKGLDEQKLAPVFSSWMTPKAGQAVRHGQGVLLDHGAVGVVPAEAILAHHGELLGQGEGEKLKI